MSNLCDPRGGTFHSWGGVEEGLAVWVVVTGFDLPTLWATMKGPHVQALLFLLQLHSQGIAGSTGSNVCEDVILTH